MLVQTGPFARYEFRKWPHSDAEVISVGGHPRPFVFCSYCGDKLLPTGEVEKRADLERKAAALDKLEAVKSSIMAMMGSGGRPEGWVFGSSWYSRIMAPTLLALADALPTPEEE